MRDAPITPGVRGDEENRRGEDADVDLGGRAACRCRPRFSTSPSTGSFLKPPWSGGAPQLRATRRRSCFTGSADSAIEGQREVDREHRDRDPADRARDRCARGRAPPRRGSTRSRSPCTRSSRPGSRARSSPTSARPPVHVSTRMLGLKMSEKPSSDEQQLRREVERPRGRCSASPPRGCRRCSGATSSDDDDAPTMMSHGFVFSGSQKIDR